MRASESDTWLAKMVLGVDESERIGHLAREDGHLLVLLETFETKSTHKGTQLRRNSELAY